MSEKQKDPGSADSPPEQYEEQALRKGWKSLLWRVPKYVKQAIYRKCQSTGKKRDAFDFLGLAISIITMVTVIIYTGATLRQTKLMRRALEDSRASSSSQEQLTRESIERTVGAMERQLTVMRRQLDEMQSEQRPWLKEANIAIAMPATIKADMSDIIVSYDIENIGHQPAFETTFNAIEQILWIRKPPGTPLSNLANDNTAFVKSWPELNNIQFLVGSRQSLIDSASITQKMCNLLREQDVVDEAKRNLIEQMNGEHPGYGVYTSGVTVFPNDKSVGNYRIQRQNNPQIVNKPPGAASFILAITTCTQYQTSTNGTVHNTGATYIIEAVDPLRPNEGAFTLGLSDNPITHVKLIPKLMGRYAD